MGEINLLDLYPKAKRNLEERVASTTAEDRRLAKQFGREYFDGLRTQGYGGYRYDGRWVPVVKRFIEHYRLNETSAILDVGCAKGFMVHDFAQALPGANVRGVDVSEYAIENALETVKPLLQVANATELPFADNSFDLIISINTIHNLKLEDLKRSLREIERVSRFSAFITVDAYHNEEERERMLKWNLTAETHMFVEEWKRLFDEVGYTGDYHWFIP